jgi:transcriptional regulator with XRE-family HTH domain
LPQLRELENSRLNLALLAKAIEAARLEQGLSLRQLAGHLGITPSTLTRIRQGKRPDAEALAVLITWTDLPIGQLLAPDDPAHRRELGPVRRIDVARA